MSNLFPSDIEIAQQAKLRHIKDIAARLNIDEDELELYGKYKAKLPLHLIDENKIAENNLILVTAITPTPAGEGKTTMTIGLTEAMNKIGAPTLAVLREPSLGPVFGMKGGAAGGGYAQVVPMEDINLHFTGDFSAIEKANNLLSALIDNNLQNKKHSLGIDPRTIVWKRAIDMNDRSLRQIVIGLGGTANGIPREDGFNITAASEIMAILCMAADRDDLKEKLGKIYIGQKYNGEAVYARDLKAEDAMAILLKDAIKPNLVQTLEGNPCIIHGGPFANIAQGTNSILATKTGLSLSKYVLTEAGFGADLGAEKFFNIKCMSSGLRPKAVVLVATLRALRHHGGAKAEQYSQADLKKVEKGFENLEKHIENLKKFGYFPVVAINYFPGDSDEEIAFIKAACKKLEVKAVVSKAFALGGSGATELADTLIREIESGRSSFRPLYDWNLSVKEKIDIISKEIYGAVQVNYTKEAEAKLKQLEKLGLNKLPVCMAKTQKSFSDNETLTGRPSGFGITVRTFEFAAGAGFVIPILGQMMRMPGLPNVPASEEMKIDSQGIVYGLS
jgi:formate--tetrahydrofolate ligase